MRYYGGMKQLQNVSLADYSTMRLGGTVRYLAEITTRDELKEAIDFAMSQNLPWIIVGTGSNIVWRDEGFDGLLIVNRIKGWEVNERDEENVYITVGAGENWDSVVERSVALGLTGIEALSLIPGTAGATPVQNVGAYGQDMSHVFLSAEAYDVQTGKFVFLSKYDCRFGYRDSMFKHEGRGRYAIVAITIHLLKGNPEPPFYDALARYFAQNNVSEITPSVVRDAVITIRSGKLPDPAKVANNGSFFTNPIVDESKIVQLQADYPDIAFWKMDGGLAAKLSASWLIERAGYKDAHDSVTGMGTWPVQPLVLVNESAKSTEDLLKFKQMIVGKVQEMFGVTLVQEPELLPLKDEPLPISGVSQDDSLAAIIEHQKPMTAEEAAKAAAIADKAL